MSEIKLELWTEFCHADSGGAEIRTVWRLGRREALPYGVVLAVEVGRGRITRGRSRERRDTHARTRVGRVLWEAAFVAPAPRIPSAAQLVEARERLYVADVARATWGGVGDPLNVGKTTREEWVAAVHAIYKK